MRGSIAFALLLLAAPFVASAEDWPALPEYDGAAQLPGQEWPIKPGPRQFRVLVHFPGGERKKVTPQTGLMLTLHNWGGTDCVGTADPKVLAKELNVVALCVNYLQSGKKESVDDPEPYDFGYLQALDALRALWWVRQGLRTAEIPFADGRIYATGGSGGGNVTLMANKLAPRTFAAVIDMCGMAKLSDDMAFNLPGGTSLDARYRREPGHPFHLTRDAQELRFIGEPAHLAVMKALKSECRVLIVHGVEDTTCPIADARELAENMQAAGLNVEPNFIDQARLDGTAFKSAGHSLGDRTKIVLKVAGKYLAPQGKESLVREGPSDFELADELVRYPTANGSYVISYKSGYPIGRFEPAPPPVAYVEHQNLKYYLDEKGGQHAIETPDDWEIRRAQIRANLELVMGKLPGPLSRVPLDMRVLEDVAVGQLRRKKISYQSDPDDRVTAYLFLPASLAGKNVDLTTAAKVPAVLCLQQTTVLGKVEPAGVGGNADMHYALELAERGYVTLAPDYPSFGEHPYDFSPRHGYDSGSMKAVWDNIRAVDLLQGLPGVEGGKLGVIGHSLGGHNAIFTAVFEPRLKAIVSSCGFTRFHKDDVPSWNGPRYMPRIATVYDNNANKLPFDFTELVGSFAPRAFLAVAATGDDDFDVGGVRDVIQSVRPIYKLLGADKKLQAIYPDAPHSFPREARLRAYEFLDAQLR